MSFCNRSNLNGNMLTEGGKVYTYNARNQLTSYTENGQTTTYDYWIDGLRRSKTLANGDEEEYLWDGNNLVYINPSLSEYLLTGFTAYYGLGIFESNQNGTKYRYQRNAHGDTTALIDQSGDIVRCYIYEDAFGTSTYSADDTNPFRYAGQYYDRESQSYYLRARYYLPRYGRFSQQDTHWNTGNMLYGDNPVTLNGRQIPNYAAISQGLNLYTYCSDNPVKYADPNGDIAITTLILIGSIIVGVAAASYTAYQSKKYTGSIDWNATITSGLSWGMIAYTGGMTAYQAYMSYCMYYGYMPVSEVHFDSNQKFLQKAANQVKTSETGHVSGTRQHTLFKNAIDERNDSFLVAEVSYKNGKIVDYGTPGSVRLDAVELDLHGKPVAVYDLKTGSAHLTPERIEQIRKEVGNPDLPVFEIRPE